MTQYSGYSDYTVNSNKYFLCTRQSTLWPQIWQSNFLEGCVATGTCGTWAGTGPASPRGSAGGQCAARAGWSAGWTRPAGSQVGRFKSGQVHGWAMYTAVHCPKYNLNHCIKDDTFTAGTDATVLYICFFRSSFVSVVGFPLCPAIFYIITQLSCSASGSLLKMS